MNSKMFKLEVDGQKLIIPEEVRKIFGEEICICKAISDVHKDSWLMFSKEVWESFVNKLNSLPSNDMNIRKFKHYFLGSCFEIKIEEEGCLSKGFADYFHLDDDLEKFDIYVEYIPEETEYRYSDYMLWVEYRECKRC